MMAIHRYTDDVVQRFWQQVDSTAGPDDCWVWRGPVHRQGHGTFPVPGIWSGPPAHRIAYHLTRGLPPPGHVVWRVCKNPLCVNPRHLEAGDRSTFRRAVQSNARSRKLATAGD